MPQSKANTATDEQKQVVWGTERLAVGREEEHKKRVCQWDLKATVRPSGRKTAMR